MRVSDAAENILEAPLVYDRNRQERDDIVIFADKNTTPHLLISRP